MKRLFIASALMLLCSIAVNVAGISLRPAGAVVPSKPYTFVAHTLAQSSQVNSDFDTLYSTLNANLDHSNFNGVGIYASQVVPDSSAHATFGGTLAFTFPNGISLGAALGTASGGTGLATLVGSRCIRSANVSAMAEAAGDCVTSVTGSGNITSTGGTTPAIGISSAPSFASVNVTGLSPSATAVCTDVSRNLTTSGCAANTVYDQAGSVVTGLIHLHGTATCTIQSTPYTYACDNSYNLTGIPNLPAAPEGGCSAGRFDTPLSYPHKEVVQAIIVNSTGSPTIELDDMLTDGAAIGTAGATVAMYFDCWVK